jgi:glycosyltransferase involved in cell wall biosynthesis
VDKYCKLKTIYNGVDLLEYRPEKSGGSIRQKYIIDDKAFLITVSARIHCMKGQKYLIEACRTLKSRIKAFYVLLAGEVDDYAYLKECQKLIKEFDIQDRVMFLGQINNVSQLLRETDIVVLPSISSEAFPRSVIEAMATGKPIIATNVGGCSEAFEDKISGFLVPGKDSGALADKILLLAKNKILREKVGSEARKRAVKLFGIHENVNQTERLYREILSKR